MTTDWSFERDELRRRCQEEAVLVSALCRELVRGAAVGDFPSDRSGAAYTLLVAWWREAYGFDAAEVSHHTNTAGTIHHQRRPESIMVQSRSHPGVITGTLAEMREVAPDLVKEISLGSVVCDALEMVYGADSVDYERDLQTLRDSLQRMRASCWSASATRTGKQHRVSHFVPRLRRRYCAPTSHDR